MLQQDRRITRGQLDKFVFTQFLIGAPQDRIVRAALRVAVWLSFVGGPVLLLLGFQLRFLPYHSIEVTYVHRVVLLLDLVLLLLLWPKISRRSAQQARAPDWKAFCRVGVAASTSIVLVAFSVFFATVPGEQTELVSIDEALSDRDAEMHGSPPHALLHRLHNLEVKLISLPILVLISERLIEPDEDKLSKLAVTLRLRGRDLQSGSFYDSDLRKADLSNTNLRNIDLLRADLRGVNLRNANLRDAEMAAANLTGADLSFATLHNASLIKAILRDVNLTGADLSGAHLSGADLSGADLNVNYVSQAELNGACGTDAKVPPRLTLRPCSTK
jgi:hypothetical protein